MSRPRIYLAGPMGGLSYDDATSWRNQAQTVLAEAGIAAYSPMRDKQFLTDEQSMSSEVNFYKSPLATSKAIMCRDFTDAINADVLLVNFLGVRKISIGTMFELAWAYDRQIPTIVIAEDDNPNVTHPMVHEAIKFHVKTLRDGIDVVKSIVLPEGAFA